MIRVVRYAEGRCVRGGVELLDPALPSAQTLWIDLESPTEQEEKQILQEYFKIHFLSFEDVLYLRRNPDSMPHFPKVEEFPDYLFVIVNPLQPDAFAAISQPDGEKWRFTTQLSAILTETMLITHHSKPLKGIDTLNQYLQKNESGAERGPDYLFHLVLDEMVDQYAPLLDEVDVALDQVEEEIFRRPRRNLLARMLQLKHGIIALRKTMTYERELLSRLCRGDFALINDRESVYYRNVYDHLIRFTELIESSREMVTDLMQTHLAAQANKLNEIMKVLAMISTTVLPMTLIAGIYGMNFELAVWPDFKTAEYGFAMALGLMGLSGASAFALFRWMKWI